MKKWILVIFLLALNAVVIFWAATNQFVTFAQVMPKDVHYVVGDKGSIDTALIKTRSDAIEDMREFFGRPMFVLSGLTLFNLAICLLFLFARPGTERDKK
jgi:hypothetical protein